MLSTLVGRNGVVCREQNGPEQSGMDGAEGDGLKQVKEHVLVRGKTQRPSRSRASLFPLSCICPLTLAKSLTLRIEAPRPHKFCLPHPFPQGCQGPPLPTTLPREPCTYHRPGSGTGPRAPTGWRSRYQKGPESSVAGSRCRFPQGTDSGGPWGRLLALEGYRDPQAQPPAWTEPLPYNLPQRQKPKPIFHTCPEHTDPQSGLAGVREGSRPQGLGGKVQRG